MLGFPQYSSRTLKLGAWPKPETRRGRGRSPGGDAHTNAKKRTKALETTGPQVWSLVNHPCSVLTGEVEGWGSVFGCDGGLPLRAGLGFSGLDPFECLVGELDMVRAGSDHTHWVRLQDYAST